jgi:hypothetical protein
MPDREKSIPHHLEPTFLRGKFLRQWDTVSEDLQPPFLESWAGPWQALRRDDTRALWAWEVRRTWQTNGHGEPAGAFLSYPLASLVAALLPYREFPQGYAVHRQPEGEDGFPVELNGVRLGFVRSGGPGQLKRLESALRVSEYLAANPEALAAVLEAAGYPVVVEALETVAARVSA